MNFTKRNNPELGAWTPFGSLREQLNRFFDPGSVSRETESFGDWSPSLDAFEDKDKYVVSVELPGLSKEAINVTVHDGVLTISGERKSNTESKDGTVHRTERSYGKFSRSVSLPTAVKADKVSAGYKDGVLIVEIPKAEEARPKNVAIS
jgi:HSP20 family protein